MCKKLKLKTLPYKDSVNYDCQKYGTYENIAVLNFDDVMSKLDDGENYYVNGIRVKTSGERLQCYNHKGTKCISCGRDGIVMMAQKHKADKNAHINLYSVGENGNLIMMTVDHTIPRSMMGRNHHENFEPMCTKCNGKKGPNCSLIDLLEYNSKHLKNLLKIEHKRTYINFVELLLHKRATAMSMSKKSKYKKIMDEQRTELKLLSEDKTKLSFDIPVEVC